MDLMDLTIKVTCTDEASDELDTLSASGATSITALGNIISNVFTKAMDVVIDSVGDAASRVDTLNNYPIVMEALGYSAEEAAASVETLTEGVDGLPTTLDSIVSVTQSLAPMCDSLEEASDLAVALNDAMLAGGGSTEVANAAMTQFTQMLAVGKVDMTAWNSVVSAAPGQMDQLAKSMLGAEANSTTLYNALSEGTLTMDDLVDAIIDLDQNGGDGFASFAEQAEAATGGIQTSVSIMKTAVVNNLSKVLDVFADEGVFSDFASTFKSAMSDIGDAAAEVAQDLVDVAPSFDEISDALTILAPALTAATAAFVTFKTGAAISDVIGAITEAGGVFNILKNSVLNLQVALSNLWVTMLANPITAIIAIIAAVVAALVTLYMTNEDFREFVNSAWEKIKEVVGGVVDAIVGFFTETLPQAIQDLQEWFTNLPENISNAIEDIKTKISEWVSNLAEKAAEVGTNFINTIVQFFNDLPGNIGYALGYAIGSVISWVGEMKDNAIEAGSNFIDNVIEFIQTLPDRFAAWLNVTISRISAWVTKTIAEAKQAGSNFISNVQTFIQQLPSKMSTWLTNTINKVTTFASNMKEKAKEAANNFKDKLIEIIETLPDRVYSIGEDIVKGIWNGITSLKDWFVNKVSSFVDGFVSGVQDALGIASPSKVFAEIGNYTIEGFAEGLEKAWANVEDFADKKTGEFITTFSAQPTLSTPLEATAATNAYDTSSTSEAESAKLDAIYEILAEIKAAIPNEVKLNSRVVARVMRGDYA